MSFNTEKQQPWWRRSQRDGLGARIKHIQRINDPATHADEVLKAVRILITVLLVFSGLLGGLSYFKNFGESFPIEAAFAMAAVLTFVIEWGKNRATTWAVRQPFFQGWQHIFNTPANTFIFIGLVLISAVTFTMSIYNSTKGGEQLALMLNHEKNYSPFQPNTADIDAQIAQQQATVNNAPKAKWKGQYYYQDARTVRSAQRSIETLQRQRADAIQQQRADYESLRATQQTNAGFASRLVLASGGWVELLQILLILLRVACEKNLDGRQSSTAPPPLSTETRGNIGFQRAPAPAVNQHADASADARKRPAGFYDLDDEGRIITASQRVSAAAAATQPLPKEKNYDIANKNYVIAATPHTASVMETLGADFVLKNLKRNIQAEIPNLADRHAKPSSVSERINKHFDEAGMYMSQPGFVPTQSVAMSVWNYLKSRAFPTLRDSGWPYDRESIFLSRLESLINTSERAGEA